MRAFHVCAGLALIVALGYVGVSWATAGVGLCLFAAIALVLVCRSSAPMRRRSPTASSHDPSRLQNERPAVMAVRKGRVAAIGNPAIEVMPRESPPINPGISEDRSPLASCFICHRGVDRQTRANRPCDFKDKGEGNEASGTTRPPFSQRQGARRGSR
jgi:hypothetical protein